MKTLLRSKKETQVNEKGLSAPQTMVEFASENWKLVRSLDRYIQGMDPLDAERFLNQFAWYQRKAQEMLDEAGLSAVDLTGMKYNTGMAVSPLNLEDFPNRPDAAYRVAQMVDPIIMENGHVRKAGTVMLREEMDE
ncbi:MAG: hypothetical protein IJJ60_15185 [Clostridia bacterium]|nr:hypothetical protein [Clostridia bacterium]